MITKDEFKKVCEIELEAMMGCMTVAAGQSDPIPMLVTIDHKGDTICNGLANFGQLKNSEARQRFLYEMGKRIAGEGSRIMMTFMAFYAWSSVVSPEEFESDFNSPREDPERQEILAFSATAIDGQTASAAIPTGRNQFKPELDATNFPEDVEIKYEYAQNSDVSNYLMAAFWCGLVKGIEDGR